MRVGALIIACKWSENPQKSINLLKDAMEIQTDTEKVDSSANADAILPKGNEDQLQAVLTNH